MNGMSSDFVNLRGFSRPTVKHVWTCVDYSSLGIATLLQRQMHEERRQLPQTSAPRVAC